MGTLALSVVAATAAVAITQVVGHPSTAHTQAVAATRPVGAPVATVTEVHKLTPPDAAVLLRHSARPAQVTRLRHRLGVRSVVVLDRGELRIGSRRLHVIGVPLAHIRALTPSFTAHSTPLWKSIARGELTVGFADSRHLHRDFGKTVAVHGAHKLQLPLRLGAFATIGLPGAQGMVVSAASRQLGLSPKRELLVVAPRISLAQLHNDVRQTLGGSARVVVTRAAPIDQAASSAYARQLIPASYLDLYRRAATTCPGLPWTVLAGIGTLETRNGENVHTSSMGASGPMQFIPSTWARWGYDADGDGRADINDPVDAVFSAARYLCAVGAGRGGTSLDDAIFSYNHAWWYVRDVILMANRFA
ncbi:MAG TPA: lytic transglycosylase domain-containing protein [Mycobacteriales bacterium]|nr:lytic transglycosylase domain-containing protein [Mycobacteriales bacterium]